MNIQCFVFHSIFNMSVNENDADSGSSSFQHGLNATINVLRNEYPTVEQNGEGDLTQQSQLLPPLEDCVCPICLEYFIDVVQTRCQHRFCKFCLENWFRISNHRRCPTCRGNVENFYRLPQFQKSICRAIQPELSDEALQERTRLRLVRQTMLENADREQEQTQSLLGRIARNRLHSTNTEVATVPNNNLISNHIINWWDDNRLDLHERLRELIRPTTNEVSIEDVPRVWRRFRRQYPDATERGSTPESRDSVPLARPVVRNSTANPTTPVALAALTDDSFSEAYRRLTSEYDNLQYQQNMMEDYNHHMQSLISAYSKIREGYRDFNYHNSRMQQITDEYQSYFERTASNADTAENNVDYEDYEDLAEAELTEFINSLPSGRAFREGLSEEGEYVGGLRRMQRGSLPERPLERHIRQIRSRFETINRSHNPPPYNSLGMERSIQSRRSQFEAMANDAMTQRLRRFNRDRGLVTPRPFRAASRNISSAAAPDIPVSIPRRENISVNQPQYSLVDDNVPTRDDSGPNNRQLRRRPHDLNHLTRVGTAGDERIRRIARRFIGYERDSITAQPETLMSNPGDTYIQDQNLQSIVEGSTRVAIPTAVVTPVRAIVQEPVRPTTTITSRPLILPRGHMVITYGRNVSSESEEEHRINLVSPTSPSVPVRPLSAPENRSNRNSSRIFHRTEIPHFCGNSLAVSSTPASNTNITVAVNQENRPATTSAALDLNGNSLGGGSSRSQIASINDEHQASQNNSSLSECVMKIFEKSATNSPSERER
ncbi:hypothetical protein Ocin01_09555 [Orchesella cincta]|uniref:RING-type domain-containing protein n=1 Tax=Orchesella cincta TaxID=48709 RepID=A0A1D2MVZ1_ORCCI|nr:hypothetical protein Ocin01_09555 [Orchesella cincta]